MYLMYLFSNRYISLVNQPAGSDQINAFLSRIRRSFPIRATCFGVKISLDYIRQKRIKNHPCMKRHFSIEMLRTHEYGIPLVIVGHGEGSHVFTFLISDFRSKIWPQTWGTSIHIQKGIHGPLWDDATSRNFKDWRSNSEFSLVDQCKSRYSQFTVNSRLK